MNRRTFLGTSAATVAALGLPQGTRAATVEEADRKLIMVFAQGGWDPTRVFADCFDLSAVSMEADSERTSAGGIGYVAHASRPSVSTFMEANHHRMLVLNGVMVRSIAHEICTMIAMTGDTSGLLPDWPAIIASAESDRYTLPHLVLGGPSFAGDRGVAVARAGQAGQLEGLLSGQIVRKSDLETFQLSRAAEGIIDTYIDRRARARATYAVPGRDAVLANRFAESIHRAVGLKDYRYVMDFTSSEDLVQQADVAVNALSAGLSRCATLGHSGAGTGGWDTHSANDTQQSPLWENLFQGLNQLMALLDETPGTVAPSLAQETTVVVLSEMGRTPGLNSNLGKDHWPNTSVMILGDGFTTDRVVGGFDETYMGLDIGFSDAEVGASGRILSIEALGATLLQRMGVDPRPWVSGTEAITGILG